MLEIYRHMPIWRKMEIVDDAIRTGRRLGLAGLSARHPRESLDRLRRRLLGLVLGDRVANEVYGPLDDVS